MRELFVEIRYVELNCILWILPNKPLNLAKAEGFGGFLLNSISVCYKNYSDMILYFLYRYLHIFFFSNQTKTWFHSTFQKTYGRTSDNNDHISSLGQSSRFITIIQTASRITKANHRICRKSASKKSISLRRKAQFKSHFFSSCQCTKMNQNLNLDQY